MAGKDFAGEGAQPPLHPVAYDGPANLFRDREADAHLRVGIVAVADEEHESGSRGAPAGVRRKEIRAFLDDC